MGNIVVGGYTLRQYFDNLFLLDTPCDNYDPRFRCIFQQTHVLPLTKTFFWFDFILWSAFSIIEYPKCLMIIWFPILSAFTTTCALQRRSAMWMLPAFPCSIILLLLNAIPLAVIYYSSLSGDRTEYPFLGNLYLELFRGRGVTYDILYVLCSFVVIILLYNCYVFYLCYFYLRSLETEGSDSGMIYDQPDYATRAEYVPQYQQRYYDAQDQYERNNF